MGRIIVALGLLMVLGMVAGATQQVTARFSSVGQAVATLPELSVLNSQVSKISLASQLNSPSFVGTVFAPINSGLQPLVDALGGDLSALGSSQQVNDIFSTSVLTQKIVLSELRNGQQLTAMNGNTVTVTITTVNGGPVYYINKARITTANILAGQAVIHEVTPILLPPTYQSMMESMGYTDTSTPVPTVEYANPVVTIPDPVPSPSPQPATPSPSPSPAVSTSPAPASSPTPGGGSDTPSSSPAPTSSSPAPSGSGSDSGSNTGGAPAPATPSPAPSTTGGSSTGGSTVTPGSTTTIPGTTTTTTSGGGFTAAPITTNNPAVTTESGAVAKDPDFGLDISAGHRPALTTALLLVPILLVALL